MDAVRYFDQISKSYKTIWLEQTNVYIMNDDGKTINCFQQNQNQNMVIIGPNHYNRI